MTTPSFSDPRAGRNVRRGDVYICDIETAGGQMWKNRPVLVVQNDRGNLWSAETIVAGLRTGGGPFLPVRVRVAAGTAGLHKDSWIDAGQLLTLKKHQLGAFVGRLPAEVMDAVDRALRISLAL